MKKSITLFMSLCGSYLLQAQTCTEVVTATRDTLTSGGTTAVVNHASLWYNAQGLPVLRKNVEPTTTAFYFDKYYYSGTRLDSIIGFTDETLTTVNGVYRKYTYDANGNLTKEAKKQLGAAAEEVTSFTYSGNALTGVSSPEFTINSVTFANGNLNSASANIPPFGDLTGTFTSDAKINPFSQKLGLTDDFLAYFNTNNVVSFGVGTNNALSISYLYDAQNRPTWLKRTEYLSGTTELKSGITYGCLQDVIAGVIDHKISVTSNVSPNPSTDGLFIINENMESVTVRNLEGAQILRTTENKLDLSAHNAGMYFLEIQTATGLKMAKVVKE
ncbi:MAG TPA: T9SS type A sorting domain-containing protein [Cytophagales bacterium]|nr:T9SS type A sorting domain-containing protein [Cytophagales bacterium]